jgi:hypothetical protein
LAGEDAMGEMQSPAEVGGILVEALHEEAAECSAETADNERDCDAPPHAWVESK